MKKALAITALVLTAGSASALTQSDASRYGLDLNTLSDTQKRVISQVIHGGGSAGEIQTFVRGFAPRG